MTSAGPVKHGALSSSLLARKGQARPAMRPQTAALTAEDDLGWNDMGDGAPDASLPPVMIQRKALRAEFTPEREAPPAAPGAPRAAFTLRLDAERHLRLRLAAAIEGVSAQTLVTRALDRLLNDIPEVEALASQLPARSKRSVTGKIR